MSKSAWMRGRGEPAVGVGAERRAGSAPGGASSSRPSTPAADRAPRTGRSRRSAAIAISGWSDRSSLPPKPPPQALGMTRTRSVGQAEDQRELVAVHVRRLGGGEDLDPSVDQARGPGLGLDVGVLDVGRLERAASAVTADSASAAAGVAQPDDPLDEDVAGRRLVELVRPRVQRRVDARSAAAAAPRSIGSSPSSIAATVAASPTSASTASPRVADVPVGEHRLVLARRVDPEPVLARDVGRREHPDQAGMARRGAAPRSPTVNRAWACGERTARRWSAPSCGRSSPKRSVPVTFSTPSVRAIRAPTARPGRGSQRARRRSPRPPTRTACTIEV